MKHVFLLAALLALAACGADEESLDAGPDPDGSTDGGDITLDPPVPPRPLTIAVTYDSDGAPIEGATVAVDRPDGTRVELTTNASGEVELEPIDWSAGDVVVTVYREGYRMRTWVLDEAPEDNALDSPLESLSPPAPVDTVTVSGTIRNAAEGFSDLYVAALVPGGTSFSQESTRWRIQVPRDTPFHLLAYQFGLVRGPDCHADDRPTPLFALLEHRGVSEPTADVVIDFAAHRVIPQTVSGSFDIPTRADSPIADHGYAEFHVFDVHSELPVGFANRLRFNSAAGRYDFRVDVVTELYEDRGPQRPLLFRASVANWCEDNWEGVRWRAFIFYDRLPDGDIGRALDIPEWRVEPSCDGRHPIDEPLAWETWEPEGTVDAWLNFFSNDTLVWQIVLTGARSPFALPQPPSTVSFDELLGPTPEVVLLTGQPRPTYPISAQSIRLAALPLTLSCE